VATEFYIEVLNRLVSEGSVQTSDSVLVVCGGPFDARSLAAAGFTDVTITNMDPVLSDQCQDAENLSYADDAFDLVVVHAGLHHCRSPHRALLEMYRVARKCALAFEARDSLMMRIAIRLGFTFDYELEAVSEDFVTGGVRNGPIPNFVYRWTEREVGNTIASYDAARIPQFRFFYRLQFPLQRLEFTDNTIKRLAARMLEPVSQFLTRLAPRQCNRFAFAVLKTGLLRPWMETPDKMSRAYTEKHRRLYVAR
jgi:SAM-dependent methyltransferase